jgi:hypothetical protein
LTDHDEIRRWAEDRKAAPACVRRTGGNGDVGMIRLDFPGYSGQQSLEHIDWDEWFQKFDESNLALLVQDSLASGGSSNFNKLIGRETANAREEGNYRASRRKGTTGARSGSASRSSGRPRSTAAVSRSASSSARSRRKASASESSDRSSRTKRAGSSRTKSSGASSRGREPGRAVSRSKSQRGSQSAQGDVTRRSGTVAGRDRGRPSASGGRQAQATNTGRRSAKRNPEKVVKSARKIKQDADNIIRMERGGKRPSRVTKRPAAKSASGTARQSRAGGNARTHKRAA